MAVALRRIIAPQQVWLSAFNILVRTKSNFQISGAIVANLSNVPQEALVVGKVYGPWVNFHIYEDVSLLWPQLHAREVLDAAKRDVISGGNTLPLRCRTAS